MEKSGPFIINKWLRLIEFYMVEYSRNSRGLEDLNPIIQYAFFFF